MTTTQERVTLNMRLKDRDEDRLEFIEESLGTTRSEGVRRAVELTAWLLSIIADGGGVYLRRADSDDFERLVFFEAPDLGRAAT